MNKTVMRRRDLLQGLGVGTLLLGPYLKASRAFGAGSQPGVGNFLLFFTPNGFVRSAFGSDGNDAGFKLRRGLAPAEAMKAHFSVVRGLSNKSQLPSNPFHDQITRLLTCVSGPDRNRSYAPSLDHVIAKLTDTAPITTSIYIYADPERFMRLSWRASGVQEPALGNPMDIYKSVFGKAVPMVSAGELESALAQQRSVLDYLKEDVGAFRTRVPTGDRARLDGHLDALRDLEKKLGSTVAAAGCNAKAAEAASTVGKRAAGRNLPEFKRHGDLTTEVIATAFACGMRNSATMLWQCPAGGLNPNAGVTGKAEVHHHVSHNQAPESVWVDIDRWYAGQYAETLQRLNTLGILDRTVVVWGSEIAQYHSHNNCTFVVGGGKALGIKHAKTFDFPFHSGEGGGLGAARDPRNASLSDLWLSVLKACGSKAETFGEHSTGGIRGLWAPV